MTEPNEVIPYTGQGEAGTGLTLFGTTDPAIIIERASKVATVLADVLKKQGMSQVIAGRSYVKVEGWTTLGAMLGVFPVTEWTRELENGWEARVLAKTRDGATVGAAEAECLSTEANWRNRESHHLRAMAQTRATSRALCMPLRFIVALAGYQSTPAEEVQDIPEKELTGGAAPAKAAAGPQAKAAGQESSTGTWRGLMDKVTYVTKKRDDESEYFLYTLHGKDGKKFTCFSDTDAGNARDAARSGATVEVRYITNKFGMKAEEVTVAQAAQS